MIDLVYRHNDFYVVVKPDGISFNDELEHIKNSVQADKTSARDVGFFNLCCQYFNETLFPMHRLDKITSGLMILGRNKEAAQWFQSAFEQKKIEKIYIALANAKPKKKQGSIVGDMEKARGSQWKLVKSKQNPAKTRFFSFGLDDKKYKRLRLFLLKPETGKTHQLRVALKSVSAAILGDELYNAEHSDRVYLHAYALRFQYQGEEFEFEHMPNTGDCFLEHQALIQQTIVSPFSKKWSSS